MGAWMESEYCLFFCYDTWWLCLTKSEWAYWVSGVGSVAAVLMALVILNIQRKHQLADRKSDEESRRLEMNAEAEKQRKDRIATYWRKTRLLTMTRRADLLAICAYCGQLQAAIKAQSTSKIKQLLREADATALERLEAACDLAVELDDDASDEYLTLVTALHSLFDAIAFAAKDVVVTDSPRVQKVSDYLELANVGIPPLLLNRS